MFVDQKSHYRRQNDGWASKITLWPWRILARILQLFSGVLSLCCQCQWCLQQSASSERNWAKLAKKENKQTRQQKHHLWFGLAFICNTFPFTLARSSKPTTLTCPDDWSSCKHKSMCLIKSTKHGISSVVLSNESVPHSFSGEWNRPGEEEIFRSSDLLTESYHRDQQKTCKTKKNKLKKSSLWRNIKHWSSSTRSRYLYPPLSTHKATIGSDLKKSETSRARRSTLKRQAENCGKWPLCCRKILNLFAEWRSMRAIGYARMYRRISCPQVWQLLVKQAEPPACVRHVSFWTTNSACIWHQKYIARLRLLLPDHAPPPSKRSDQHAHTPNLFVRPGTKKEVKLTFSFHGVRPLTNFWIRSCEKGTREEVINDHNL